MSAEKFTFGDRLRHPARPEWGVGTVVRAEDLPSNGRPVQRLAVRFPNAGLKTLNTAHASLERCAGNAAPRLDDDRETVADLDGLHQSEWLAPVAQRRIQETMTALPGNVRDPFNSLEQRLALTMGLFRFERTGGSLIDWAVGQSGLDDPLGRFTRQELEQHFDRWAMERENHLRALLDEVGRDSASVTAALAKAPDAAREAVRRLTGSR